MRCMDRGSLERLLGQGLSLAEIGRRFDRHEATVSHWMKKYGLEAVQREKHAARGGIDRQRLVRLVDAGASIAEMATAIDRSKATVRYWLKRYDLKTKAPMGAPPRPGAAEARASGQVETLLDCPRHGGRCTYLRSAVTTDAGSAESKR